MQRPRRGVHFDHAEAAAVGHVAPMQLGDERCIRAAREHGGTRAVRHLHDGAALGDDGVEEVGRGEQGLYLGQQASTDEHGHDARAARFSKRVGNVAVEPAIDGDGAVEVQRQHAELHVTTSRQRPTWRNQPTKPPPTPPPRHQPKTPPVTGGRSRAARGGRPPTGRRCCHAHPRG